jgi:hypothetical protein
VCVEFFSEPLDLLSVQKAIGTARFPTAEGFQAPLVIPIEPVIDRMFTGEQNGGDVAVGSALGFEKNTVQAVAQAQVFLGFVATYQFGVLVVCQGKEAFHASYSAP